MLLKRVINCIIGVLMRKFDKREGLLALFSKVYFLSIAKRECDLLGC